MASNLFPFTKNTKTKGEIALKNKQIQLQLEAISDKMERLQIQKEFYQKLLRQEGNKEN